MSGHLRIVWALWRRHGGHGGQSTGPSTTLIEALQCLRTLETQHGSIAITMGSKVFTCFEDVRTFVIANIQVPNFGVLSDMVIVLQKLKTTTQTAQSLMTTCNGAQKLNLDMLEANILVLFLGLFSSILDKSGKYVASSHVNAIPAVKKYLDWTNTLIGLRTKIQSEMQNALKGVSSCIQNSAMTEVARGVFTSMLLSSKLQW